jgi:hypothetical protein
MSVTRKAARKALAALLATLPDFEAIYDYENEDFERLSPVAMVHSDGSAMTGAATFADLPRLHALIISVLWRRTETTEDAIDDLSAKVLDLIEDNEQTADWNQITLEETGSELDYPIIDGHQYRRERFTVFIW